MLQKSQKCILKVLPNLIWFNLERLTKKERKKKKNRENLQTNNFSRTTKFYQFPGTIFNLYFYNLINIYFLHEFVWFHHDLIDTYLQIIYIKRRKNKILEERSKHSTTPRRHFFNLYFHDFRNEYFIIDWTVFSKYHPI